MQEIKVWIANLGKYNEGESQGAWFTLPATFEEVAEKIGLNSQYEEYAIHDYEAPFRIDQFESLERLNNIAELYEENSNHPAIDFIGELMDNAFFSNIEEALEKIDDVIIHESCTTGEDLAYEYIDSTGLLSDVDSTLSTYFDYEALGRDMLIEGNYHKVKQGFYVEVPY
ncbi:antirestriction protein ArdA [Listeria costaricensis]|uniref:antirestriction protein ArdA n=1 Tax=Listeria costaricensis TaxID=2026604 RepID=UPI000C089CFB|nr:antirestriction protein ArdA [Listeria costaricensis]